MHLTLLPIVLLAFTASAVAQTSDRVTLMTYNVENFFDNEDDPRYDNDRETINSSEYMDAKSAAIARVISRFDNGEGPDVLVLTEIESLVSLSALKDALASSADYQTQVFFDADPNRSGPKPDFRGIDVAILSKLPLASGTTPKNHVIDLTGENNCNTDNGDLGSTRDALEANLTLPDGSIITVFGVHFPSSRNPTVCREIAAEIIREKANALPNNHTVLIAGDFNFNCRDNEQTALQQIFSGWKLPVQLNNGCVGNGSQWFSRENTWSYLDVIAERPGSTTWQTDMRTFRLVLNDIEQFFFQSDVSILRPKKFRLNSANPMKSGTSDHYPVAIDVSR